MTYCFKEGINHFPHRLYRDMDDEIVPKNPANDELTFSLPKKWKITGRSTLLLQMLRNLRKACISKAFNF